MSELGHERPKATVAVAKFDDTAALLKGDFRRSRADGIRSQSRGRFL